jgi:heme oxygenase
MAWSQATLDAIEAAIGAGELSVRFPDGRAVQYRSMTELLEARAVIKEAITAAASGAPGTKSTFVQHSKG